MSKIFKNTPDKSTVRIILISLLLIVAIGVLSRREAISAFFSSKKDNGPQPVYVKVETVNRSSTVRDNIVQNTAIDAVKRVKMLPRVSGRLESMNVKPGDTVKAGQVVATLEHDQQNAQIEAGAAQVASAKADTERAKAEMMNAKTNLERYQRLVKEGFSTQQQYDSIATTYTSAKAGHTAALAKERQTASDLNRLRSSRGDYIILAPLNGTVLDNYSLTPGTMISPSSPILDIADLKLMKATLKIPESKIFIVRKGMSVTLKFDAIPEREFEGKVSRVDQFVDPETRTSNVEIYLDNEAAGFALRPGMFGQASIIEKEYRNAITVPEGAIHNNEKDQYVFVMEKDTAKLKSVSTGIKQGITIQITKGLNPGEKVIVFGGNNLNDGDKVTTQAR